MFNDPDPDYLEQNKLPWPKLTYEILRYSVIKTHNNNIDGDGTFSFDSTARSCQSGLVAD